MKRKKKPMGYSCAVFLFLTFTLGPLIWAFIISITPEYEMFKNTTQFLPNEITWGNYRELFNTISQQHIRLFRGMKNSMQTLFFTILIGVPIATLSAYTLNTMQFKGKKFIENSILITMVFPVFTTIIPLYRIFSSWGILNNMFWLSIVYVSSFLPMNTWIMMNYFNTIPNELREAAYVDGCGQIRVFFKIIFPLAYPILLASGLIMFLSGWSQFQIPLILASNMNTKPIAIVASEFMTKDSILYGLTAAAGIICILPPAVVALVFRKYLVDCMASGSVKG